MDIQLVFNQQNTDIGMLGRQGENNETRLVIDCQSVLAEHPDAVIGVRMMGRLPGEKYYDLPVTHEGDGVYVAKLSTFDLCWDGNKEIQVRAIVGEWEKRSARFQGYVAKSLFDFRPPTGVVSDWRDECRLVLCRSWEDKDVAPVVTSAGFTKTMAPRDGKTTYEEIIPRPELDVHDFYRNFADAIDGKATQIVTHNQLRRSMKIMEAAFASDALGAPVAFEDIETEPRTIC